MDVGQLRTFLAVLEHGSFSHAAEALRIGQSTASFHIKALETSVGTRLLDRRGGRVRPTATGAVLRRYALRIVSLRDEALARLRAEESGEAGRLTIAASTIPGEYLLPQHRGRQAMCDRGHRFGSAVATLGRGGPRCRAVGDRRGARAPGASQLLRGKAAHRDALGGRQGALRPAASESSITSI